MSIISMDRIKDIRAYYKGISLIESKHIAINRMHLYVNPVFGKIIYGRLAGEMISFYDIPTKNHRYHIFINTLFPTNIINESMMKYIEWVNETWGYRVFIHIPKGRKDLLDATKALLQDKVKYTIIYSKRSLPMVFRADDGTSFYDFDYNGKPGYMIIRWRGDSGVSIEFTTEKEGWTK